MTTTESAAQETQVKKTFPVLRMPDPKFSIRMLEEENLTGLFCSAKREEGIGQEQVLVNELCREGDKPFAFGIVKVGEGEKVDGIGAVSKSLSEGIDDFTMREFQPVKTFWFHPFELVKAFKPIVELKKTTSEVDLDQDQKKLSGLDKNEVPEELLLFAVSDSAIIPLDMDAEIKEAGAGPDFVLAVPGAVKPWLIFPLDHANDIQAEEQATEIVAARKAAIGVMAARIGDLSPGVPVFSAKVLLRSSPMHKASDIDEILIVSPEELAEASDKALDRFYSQLHRFRTECFAGDEEETGDGIAKKDVVTAYSFVMEELKSRDRQPAPTDELDSELKDLFPSVFEKFDPEIKKFVDKLLKKRLSIIKGEHGGEEEEAEEHIIYGVVLEPETVDSQEDVYSEEEVRNAAHLFMEEFRHLGFQHKVRLDGRLKILETYIAPQDLTINGQEVKKGTWLMVIRVLDDELWDAVKDGRLTGLSIGGSARKEPEVVAA